ncbi:MAG: hypothetical protein ACK5K7_02360, partial [Bacilli bacterium]
MDKNIKSKLLGLISFISILLIVFFAVKYLSSQAEDLEIDSDVQTEEAEITSEQYITPKLNTLYVYYSYTGDQTIDDSQFYKNEIVIESRDNYIQKKCVLSDFSEYDELILNESDQSLVRGESTLNIRESLIDTVRFYEDNNVFVNEEESVLLTNPIQLNSTWQYSSKAVSEITSLSTLVELPFGTFTAIEVVTNYEDGRFRKD